MWYTVFKGGAKMKKEYGSIKIDKETYDKLSAISKRTDIPIVRLIKKAVELLEVKL